MSFFCVLILNAHDHDTLHGRFRFFPNNGQWKEDFKFKADFKGGAVYLHKNKWIFDLYRQSDVNELLAFKSERAGQKPNGTERIHHHAYSLTFVGSKDPTFEGLHPSESYFNFFLGNDSNLWRGNQRAYSEILMNDLYPGIDVRMDGSGDFLKYEFIVNPNADAGMIKMKYSGVEKIRLVNGNLIIQTSIGDVVELAPVCFSGKNRDHIIPSRFVLKGDEVWFDFPDGYDRSQPLIIDPSVVFASYSGSSADNWGYTATFDSQGCLYAGGNAFAVGYPVTLGAYQTTYANNVDIVISKYSASGNSLIYSTYLGGSGADVPASIIVNEANELYVLSVTGSSNYPTTSACIDASFNGGTPYTLTYVIDYASGSDAAVSCFNASGTSLMASTFLGGSGNDGLNMSSILKKNYADDVRGEILLDAHSNVYVVSSTASSNFPVSDGSFQESFGGGSQDGFILKADRTLSTILWASYLGGSAEDAVYNVALAENAIYLSGGTASANFPVTAGVLQPVFQGGVCDGFVTEISIDGSSITKSSFWGTAAYDQSYFVETDKQSNVYLFGQTASSGTEMIDNALWYTNGGGQFISKLNPDLNAVIWSTRFGTSPGVINISPTAFLVDYCKNIYLSGWGSQSLNGFGGTAGLPTTSDAFQHTTDNSDYYFMSIRDDASALVYASFYGGTSAEHVDGGTSRFDRMGRIYQSVCAGCGGNDDFPTSSGAWSNQNNSTNCNNGVIKMDFNIPAIVADFMQPPIICLPAAINFQNNSYQPHPSSTFCYWDFGDGTNSNLCNPSHTYSSGGVYNVMLVMTDVGSCNMADTIIKQIIVLSNNEANLDTVSYCSGLSAPIGLMPLPGSGISYSWFPATFLSNPNVSNPTCSAPTDMSYRLIISNGICTDTLYQWVDVKTLSIDAGNNFSACSMGVPLIAFANGDGDFSFHWSSNHSFSNFLNPTPQDSIGITNFATSHTYYLQVSTPFCIRYDSVVVDIQAVNPGLAVIHPLCYGDTNAWLISNPINGQQPYHFLWSTGDTTSSVSNMGSGIYYLTVSDHLGCVSYDTATIVDPPLLSISTVSTTAHCDNACNATITAIVSGGTPPYSYLWSNGQQNAISADLCQGIYYLTVSDQNQCKSFGEDTVVVEYIYNNVDAWADQYVIFQGQSTAIHASFIPGVSYSWSPDYALSNSFSANTIASPSVSTVYTVFMDDGYGCQIHDSLRIDVLEVLCYEPYIFVPNSFTPNGDGLNDQFRVKSNYIDKFHLVIFDRWGEKVFESFEADDVWDGTFRGRALDPAVFDYYVEITCYNKWVFSKKGNITLLR